MENKPRPHPDDFPSLVGGPAAVSSGSSSSNLAPPSDLPTTFDMDPATMVDGVTPSQALASNPFLGDHGTFPPGMVLAQRYQIVQLLGEGGMGSVYKAKDRELNRVVALKVIRPDLARNTAIVERFKHELRLSHQVTHKNVIRIYDLGESDGVKFITMEFIEGQDLRSLIQERKKLPPEEAVEIMRQVCQALEAAHTVGIIHRDLKPQNIIREHTGRILVMDFGLARTVGGDGMTQTGALVGTMEYMSPEQALGKKLDQRSDLFSAGLMFYELLTGKMPFQAESAIASLLKRTQERAISVSSHDATIPAALSSIVSKCLESDPEFRHRTATEILADLEVWQGKLAAATIKFEPSVKPWGQDINWPLLGGIVMAVVLAVAGFLLRQKLFGPSAAQPAAGPAISLAILPFRNASDDASLDWLGSSMAEMLSTDVGQSTQLHTVSPSRVHQIFRDLRIAPSTVLDPPTIRRVADFSDADRLVWGQYARFGDQIRIDATLQDLKSERSIPLKIDVANEKDISDAIDRLAESIRQKLALPEGVLKELKASSFQPSSKSVEALRDYNAGILLQRDGMYLEAQKQFEAATKEDPEFALAFSHVAQTYSSLGYDSEAEQAAQNGVLLSQNLSDSERYLISGIRSRVTKNYPEAIKAYESLAKAAPDNSDIQSALAGLYDESGDLDRAREYYQRILTTSPKDVVATLQLGRVTIKTGDPQGSLETLNRAYSLAVQMDNQEQKAASLHVMAVAYRMLSKPEEGIHSEQEALAVWRQIGQKRGLALSLNEVARDQALLGKNRDAMENFQQAMQVRREIGDKRGLGDTLIDFGNFYDDQGGDHDQALKMYKEALQLERDLGNESLQAICLNNIGSVYSEKGQFDDALTYFQQALQLREKSNVPQDIVEAVHNLGDASAEIGQYDQAISQYLRALDLRRKMGDKRGAAIESYSLGKLFDYQGRFGAALKSKEDALKTFRDLKDQTFWMAEVLGGYGQALILGGRGADADAYLKEALKLSRELKNDGILAQTLGFQGDAAFYSGDLKSARSAYEQELQAATRSKEPDKVVIAKANLARISVQEKRAPQAISSLRLLVTQGDSVGLKYVSVESSVSLAEAMVQDRNFAQAKPELNRTLLRADKLGMQPLSVRAHFLLATIARNSGSKNEAQQHFQEARRLLDAMRKDPGAENLLRRADFKNIYDAAAGSPELPKNR